MSLLFRVVVCAPGNLGSGFPIASVEVMRIDDIGEESRALSILESVIQPGEEGQVLQHQRVLHVRRWKPISGDS
jgi:hypothetical protein